MTDVTRERMDIRDLAGARVLVLGAGVSGPGAVRILHALGAEPVVADSRPEAVEL
ncbi:UDP-N-acetylmuramoyl-L-alanine--D-glutamate ligase, partial [Dietzia cercidiphylli]|nr:UDP-N-acetylmuramoyl-L-alanine--D-glutamate ligase [Dietzia cercidiphylli]